MRIKNKKTTIIFIIILIIFTTLFSLGIVYDYNVSKYIYLNNINEVFIVFNIIFDVFGWYILTVPLFVSILAIIRVLSDRWNIKKAIKIFIIVISNLIFATSAILLTYNTEWHYLNLMQHLTEFISALFVYLFTISMIIFLNLFFFTKKIIKHTIDEEWLFKKAVCCLMYIALSFLIVTIFKYSFGRPRPFQVFNENYDFYYAFQINFSSMRGVSFPSGHTVSAASLFGLLFFWKITNKSKKSLLIFLKIIIAVLTILTALSRVLYLYHFTTDVMLSIFFCWVFFINTDFLYNKIFNNLLKRKEDSSNG